MESLLPLVMVAAVLGLMFRMSSSLAAGTEAAWHGFFAGHRPDPWPHGVQEEDRDHRWGAGPEPSEPDGSGEPPSVWGTVDLATIIDGPERPLDQAYPGSAGRSSALSRPVRGAVHLRH